MVTTQCFDVGNTYVKHYSGIEPPSLLESVLAAVPPGSRSNPQYDSKSRLVKYLGGTRADLVGEAWMIGAKARSYRGSKLVAQNSQKIALALQMVLATATFPTNSAELTMDKLITFLPEASVQEELMRDALEGEHHFNRNGKNYKLLIPRSSIVVHEEGQGAANLMRLLGMVPSDKFVGVIDIGGGTMIGTLFDPMGEVVEESRHVVGPGGHGVYSGLAITLAQTPALIQAVGGSVDPRLVLEAVVNNEYETYQHSNGPMGEVYRIRPKFPLRYGESSVEFSDLFSLIHDQWLKESIGKIFDAWKPWANRVAKVALIGGGAKLAGSIVENPVNQKKGKVFILEHPDFEAAYQVGNVLGVHPAVLTQGLASLGRTTKGKASEAINNGKVPGSVAAATTAL